MVTSLGVGRRITTVVGFIATMRGRGRRAVGITAIAVGGVRRWSRLYRLTSHSETISAGIRCLTTSAIRTHVTTVIMIDDLMVVEAGMRVVVPEVAIRVVGPEGNRAPVNPVLANRVVEVVSQRDGFLITKRGVV